LRASITLARLFSFVRVRERTRIAQPHRSVAASRHRPRKWLSLIPIAPAHPWQGGSCGLDIGGARVSRGRHFQEAGSRTIDVYCHSFSQKFRNQTINIAERDSTHRFSTRDPGISRIENKAEIYPGACCGRRPRPRGSGRRRSKMTAGSFLRRWPVPCARPRYSRAAPSGSANRHDGAARGAAWPVRSRSYWRALAARPRASQSTCGNHGGIAGLTDLGELAKSCRPWIADSGTSLSPDGGGGGDDYSRCHLRRRVRRLPRIVPIASLLLLGRLRTRRPRTREDRPRGSRAHHVTERRRERRQFDSSRTRSLRRCHSGLTGTAGTAPPGAASCVQAYSERPRRVPHRRFAVKHGGA